MKYNPDIHHRRSIRLQHYNYSQRGAYFIKICIQNAHLFGHIINDVMILNEAGKMIDEQWQKSAIRFNGILLDEYIIIPNHFHGILMIREQRERTNCHIKLIQKQCTSVITNDLLILLPELETLNRREIASLTGLAPIARDSGQLKGYRRTGHGREGIKPTLFMAAMAARNSNSSLRTYYQSLVGRGKKKMVALTALMRKIIVIANARLKEIEAV